MPVGRRMLAPQSSPPMETQDSRRGSAGSLLFAIGLASVVTSLALRVVHRGSNMPGWDLLLTVEGQYLLATHGLWGALRETFIQVRTFWLPPSAYSLPYGLIPGALASWWQGFFWQPVVVFAAWLSTLALLLRATGWRLSSREGWAIALLAWGASPALLSYSVEGYPWGGGMLPHALALALALADPPWGWLTTLLALVALWELPWHGYELGKTAGLTLLVCALLAPRLGIVRRLAFALVGISEFYAATWLWPSHNMIALEQGNVGTGVGIFHAVSVLPDGVTRLASALLGTHPLIFPTLAVSGAVALIWSGKRARVLGPVWALQLFLVLLLAAAGTNLLRARRFQGVETLALAGMLAGLPRAPRAARRALLAVLIAGNVWTLVDGVRFATATLPTPVYSLPGVESADGVGTLDLAANAWAESLAARAQAGERLVLLHGQVCPSEYLTNPVGVLERLYLRLGHQRFRERVVAIASARPTYVTVPVVDLREALGQLTPGTLVDMDTLCASEMVDPLHALESRFTLTRLTGPGDRFAKFRLDPLPGAPSPPSPAPG